MRRLATILLVLVARRAAADCDVAQARLLREQLRDESHRMDRWRYGWSAANGIATIGQLALVVAKYNPAGPYDRTYRDAMYVGAAQSGIQAIAQLFVPGIEVPPEQSDPCADLAALRAARARNAATERTVFFGTHVANLGINLAGSAFLVLDTDWTTALVAFAIGYPIGLLDTYTMPRDSWRAVRVTALPVPGNGAALGLAGTF